MELEANTCEQYNPAFQVSDMCFLLSNRDHSRSLEYHDTASKTSKAVVGVALRDLDALGDWIESELHDSQVSPKGTTASVSTPTTPDITINGKPGHTVSPIL